MAEPSQVLNKTPLTMTEVAGYLSKYVGQPALGYLLALIHLENEGGAKIWNHNWGNITTNDPSAGFQFPTDQERIFLNNPDHEQGAAAFFKRLNSPTHKRMLQAARANDFDAFWTGYQTPHPVTKMMYCDTCSFDAAREGMRSLVKKYVPKNLSTDKKSGGGGGLLLAAAGVAAVVGTAYYMGKKRGRAYG